MLQFQLTLDEPHDPVNDALHAGGGAVALSVPGGALSTPGGALSTVGEASADVVASPALESLESPEASSVAPPASSPAASPTGKSAASPCAESTWAPSASVAASPCAPSLVTDPPQAQAASAASAATERRTSRLRPMLPARRRCFRIGVEDALTRLSRQHAGSRSQGLIDCFSIFLMTRIRHLASAPRARERGCRPRRAASVSG